MTAWSMSQRGPHKGMHNIIILIYHSIWCVFSPSPSIWCYLYVFYIHVCARINVKAHWDKGRFGSRSGFCRCLTSCQSGLRKGLGKGPGLDSRQMISVMHFTSLFFQSTLRSLSCLRNLMYTKYVKIEPMIASTTPTIILYIDDIRISEYLFLSSAISSVPDVQVARGKRQGWPLHSNILEYVKNC